MGTQKQLKDLIDTVDKKISPSTLNEMGRTHLTNLLNKYNFKLLVECINISYSKYIQLDDNGKPTKRLCYCFLR